jgi:hypothetical protein
MPVYSIFCKKCGSIDEVVRTIDERDTLPDCCGAKMTRAMCALMVQSDITPYQSQVTGEMIKTRRQHRNHLKDHKLIEVGNEKVYTPHLTPPPGLKEEIIKNVMNHR